MSSSSSTGTPTIGGATTDATPCPDGEPCTPDDPCALAATCDAFGTCVPTTFVTCDDPPSACHASEGVCDVLGQCVYEPHPAGHACDDGDDCTVSDFCDGAGACTPGELCPNDNPCMVAGCVEGSCVSEPVADGTSCGRQPALRCCSGSCVDISSDTEHCGGCDTPCAAGLACESISQTSSCEVSPPATSGRCRCQYSNAQCPHGQLCRTYLPYTDRCVPPGDANCDGVAVFQNSCPPFCSYD